MRCGELMTTFGANSCLTIKTKMKMKKILFVVAAVALMAFTACNKEEINTSVEAAAGTVEFVAGFDAETKTTLSEGKTLWVAGDEISINGQIFEIKKLVNDGESAVFINKNELPADFAAPYVALYPANVTEIPTEQTIEAGKVNPAYMLERADSDGYSLSFKNMVSLLKFQVSASCSTITLTSEDELAGSEAKEIIVKGPLKANEDYYISVIPGEKKNFSVKADGCEVKSADKVTINRSSIVNMGSFKTTVRLYVTSEKTEFTMNIYAWGIDGVELPNAWPGKSLSWDSTVSKYYYDFPIAIKGKELSFIINVNGDECKSADQKITFDDIQETFNLNWKWLYLKPNSNWKQSSAKFAAYFFTKNVSGEYWQKMMMMDNNHYGCIIPGTYKNVIFCRMNTSGYMGWDNKWNQTADLTVPTNGNNLYTVKDGTWDKGGGTWSTK